MNLNGHLSQSPDPITIKKVYFPLKSFTQVKQEGYTYLPIFMPNIWSLHFIEQSEPIYWQLLPYVAKANIGQKGEENLHKES